MENIKQMCLVKSYLSDTAIQNWIIDKKEKGYKLTFFDTQYDPVRATMVYTAVMELEECKK